VVAFRFTIQTTKKHILNFIAFLTVIVVTMQTDVAIERVIKVPSLNLIVFSSFSTLPLEQCLNHPNSATLHFFSSLFTGSKLNSVSNIKFYLSPSKLFSLDNLLISIAFSMFNLTVLLAPLTSLPCNVHQSAHVSK